MNKNKKDLRPVFVRTHSGETKSGLFHEWNIVDKGSYSNLLGVVELKTENGFGKAILVPAEGILFSDYGEEVQ